jgi:DNA polymerase III epsilon subunit-like protein
MVKVIYYDLETTNLRPLTGPNGIEIVQIGAVCKHTRNKKTQELNIYLVPNREISAGATQVHGLTRDSLREFDDVFRPK